MDKKKLLEELMARMGELGYPFLGAIEEAHENGASDSFIQDARNLLAQLSGKPGEGSIECIKNVGRDLRAVEEFIKRWESNEDNSEYTAAFRIVRQVLKLLREFNETLKAMSFWQRLTAELTALYGRAMYALFGRKVAEAPISALPHLVFIATILLASIVLTIILAIIFKLQAHFAN